MGKTYSIRRLLLIVFFVFVFLYAKKTEASVTQYKGIDYGRVYNFEYYKTHNTYVRKHFSGNPEKALKYFVTKGMKKRHRASAEFDVNSYINGNKDLRRLYKKNYKKYYLHYIRTGYKTASYKATATGITSMRNACTRYAGLDYSPIYDYAYYIANNKAVKKKFGVDDLGAFEYFIGHDLPRGVKGNASFDVKKFRSDNPSLQKKFGYDYEKYAEYYLKNAKTDAVQKITAAVPAVTAAKAQPEDTIVYFDDVETVNPGNKSAEGGKKTLKNYLKTALIPCGRTLYVWGGGWDESDSSIIGYQEKWSTFFNQHAREGYDYKNYRYKYGYGLDCSGFAAWTLYNTLYTKSGGPWLVFHSTEAAAEYASRGWCTLATDSSDRTFKPGDVVSMDGHVWISLGQYSDGSVLVIHSSPNGVQISGTAGQAASAASYYMRKYFPKWPFDARTVGPGYLKYAGKARWKNGALLSDPDGIQNMSAGQVMKCILGS